MSRTMTAEAIAEDMQRRPAGNMARPIEPSAYHDLVRDLRAMARAVRVEKDWHGCAVVLDQAAEILARIRFNLEGAA